MCMHCNSAKLLIVLIGLKKKLKGKPKKIKRSGTYYYEANDRAG